jgi:hypothetical protein
MVEAASRAVQRTAAAVPALAWTKDKVVEGLEHFISVRRELGLLAS